MPSDAPLPAPDLPPAARSAGAALPEAAEALARAAAPDPAAPEAAEALARAAAPDPAEALARAAAEALARAAVPDPTAPEAAEALARAAALLLGRRIVALTGAGCSTESGIPDYRGPGTRARARNPVQYRAFVEDAAARQRYWARAMLGWPRFSAARPNDGHRAFAALEAAGLLRGVITQNVDRLHHAAGSRRVVELHGALAEVVCLGCGGVEARDAVQDRLVRLNPRWDLAAELAPDGDAELDAVDGFRVADCLACGGVLKPRVVFFGESVPRPVVDDAFALLDEGDALLVVGTSLTVYSGFRFVRRAAERGVPVVLLTFGPTRGDALADVRVEVGVGEGMRALVAALSASNRR